MKALRTFIIVVMILGSRGTFLHYISGDCGGDEKCPICQQVVNGPAEDVPLFSVPVIDWGSCETIASPIAVPYFYDDAPPTYPRAPPA